MAVRVGILGAGFIGRVHALDLRGDPRVELVGVADTVPQAAQKLAGDAGTRALPDLAALLDSGADAVYITTPNTLHVQPSSPPSATACTSSPKSPWRPLSRMRGGFTRRRSARRESTRSGSIAGSRTCTGLPRHRSTKATSSRSPHS